MRLRPAGEGVGGKAGVNHRQRRGVVLALQIVVKGAQLRHQHHALVDNGAAGEGADISVGLLLFELPSEDVKAPVERLLAGGILAGGRESTGGCGACCAAPTRPAIPDGRARRARGARACPPPPPENRRCGRCSPRRSRRPAKRTCPRRIRLLRRGTTPASAAQLGKERVRQAREDAHAVAGGARGVAASAVRQPFDDGQRVGYCAVCGLSAQVDHRAHAAGFVFHLRVVERISGRHGGFPPGCYAFDCKIFAARSVSFKPRSMAFFCK